MATAKKVAFPEIKKYMDRKLNVEINASRHITGTLRGFDQFMNLVLADASVTTPGQPAADVGFMVVRGNAISLIECLERPMEQPSYR